MLTFARGQRLMWCRQLHILSRVSLCCTLALLLCTAAAPGANGQGDATPAATPVARLSLIEGEVRVASSGYHAETIDAALNMPLAAGQLLQTGVNASAEAEFPDGSVLRSAAKGAATLIRLQPQTEIGLDDGLYYLELRAGTESQYVVYAGDLSMEPKENASFRVHVANGQPEVAVLRGTVSVTRANSYTVDVQQGESLRTDSKDNRRYLLADAVGAESGDSWNERRAQQIADAGANQTIAREDYAGDQGYGWSDLDSNGAWYPLPGEGLVWQPYGVDASFDPYGYGSWVYRGVASGGYVWASGYSWGWLPYHCGSWGFFPAFGWGWQPAAGCRSYGGGWPVGGFPVNHPPHDWHHPLQPRPPASNGIVVRHPTLPVATPGGILHLTADGPRRRQPIQVNGVSLHPLSPVAPVPTPRGSSAVGSALRRDYPVQNETHRPLLGLEREGIAVMPGRVPEWHTPSPTQNRAEESGSGEAFHRAERAAPDRGAAAVSEKAGEPATGAAPAQTFVTGWHSRIVPVPAEPGSRWPDRGTSSRPAPPSGLHSVPGPAGAVPYAPPGARGAENPPAIRVTPITPGPPRAVAPPQPPRVLVPAPPPRAMTPSPAPPATPPHFSAPPPTHINVSPATGGRPR